MRAFRHAAELGYTHIETDVQATSDGVAVLFHDTTLDRCTDGRGVVSKMKWRDLRAVRIAGTDRIVRLEELFEELPHVRVNLDPKTDAAAGSLVDAVRATQTIERVCVCSFSDRRTRKIRRRLGESLCVGAGPLGVARLLAASWRLPVGTTLDFHVAQVPLRSAAIPIVREGVLAAAHRHDVAVHVWTIDDEAEMHRLLDMGVDGIMTDQPEVLRQVMIDRGHWTA